MINTNSSKDKINISFITPGAGSVGKGAVTSVQGRTGDVVLTAEDVKALPEDTYIPSLEGYATEEYVIETVQDLELENYYTKEEIDVAIENVEVDLTGYATEEYVQNVVEGLEGPMGPQGPQGEPGTSGIYIGSEEPTDEDMMVWIDLEGTPDGNLATMGYVDQAIADAAPDLTPYALKTEIPSTTGLATETYVQEQIAAIPDVDLSDYATTQYVYEKFNSIEIPDVDLTGYATEQYVDDAIDAIEIPDNTPIATTEVAGKVKPDGTTILISEDGTISSIATGGGGEGVQEIFVGAEDPGNTSDALIWINPEGDASTQYATQAYVDAAIAAIVDGDEVSY